MHELHRAEAWSYKLRPSFLHISPLTSSWKRENEITRTNIFPIRSPQHLHRLKPTITWSLRALISDRWVEMQPVGSSPLSRPVLNPFSFNDDLSSGGFGGPRVLFLASLLLFQGGGMDLSKVGEKILSSVRSARSLGILSPPSDRPEVGTWFLFAGFRFSF